MNLDTQLHQLDAAQGIPDDLAKRARARETLSALLSGDTGTSTPPSGRRPRHRVLRYAVAAGVVSLAGAVLTDFLGGSTAYASWTATARLANPVEETRWGADCLSRYAGHGYAVRLVELRGQYAYTVLGGNDGYEATCLMVDHGTDREVTGGGYEGSLTQSPSAGGLVTNSIRAQSDDDGNAAFEVTGKAGADVASVVIEAEGVDVLATMKDGYFAAWWPGRDTMIPKQGPLNPRIRITLADGTVRMARIQDFDVSPS
jgi:hypothetical protein